LNETNYQIVQAIAGRTRIRIPWLKTHEEAAGKLQRLVESLNPVTSVRINPLAQSIIIFYRASALSPRELEAQVASAIEQAHPGVGEAPTSSPVGAAAAASSRVSPASAAGTSETAPPSASGAAAVVAAPEAQNTSVPPPANVPCDAIPSPWDEPSEASPAANLGENAPVETAVEPAPVVPEAAPQPRPTVAKVEFAPPEETAPTVHSTASLAKRLNTTSQAITHRRNRPDFPTWTQSQDPERIAWKYDPASQSFGPADREDPIVPAAIAPPAANPPAADTTPEAAEVPSAPTPKRPTKRPATKSKKSASRRSSRKR
jgi:hypothetical protein